MMFEFPLPVTVPAYSVLVASVLRSIIKWLLLNSEAVVHSTLTAFPTHTALKVTSSTGKAIDCGAMLKFSVAKLFHATLLTRDNAGEAAATGVIAPRSRH